MRTGAAEGHQGYYHEAVCYTSDDDLLAVALPFLRGGAEAGEPTLVSLGERTGGLLRAALGDVTGVEFLAGGDVYARPAVAIRSYQELMGRHVANGAGQIRIIGEIPAWGLGATWDWWARYEAAINEAYNPYPLWSLCAYDTRTTPVPVLEDVARTHPRHAAPDGTHRHSPAYTGPVEFLGRERVVPPDPVERATPDVDLLGPMPSEARHAVARLPHGYLARGRFDDFLVAVSEVVTNAIEHGAPPVRLRCWTAPDRLVAVVTDGGRGPSDPFAGLLPAAKAPNGGLGLWLAHQLCDHVTFGRAPGGEFVIRLTAGTPLS